MSHGSDLYFKVPATLQIGARKHHCLLEMTELSYMARQFKNLYGLLCKKNNLSTLNKSDWVRLSKSRGLAKRNYEEMHLEPSTAISSLALLRHLHSTRGG